MTAPRAIRVRRPPPPLVPAAVVDVARIAPRMARVTFDIENFFVEQPAASVRLLTPSPGTDALVIPDWNGNEFLLPDGSRPALRTFTPSLTRPLHVDIVLHGRGAVSSWAERVEVGWPVALSGPGRGYVTDDDASDFLLLGDQTAIPAIGQVTDAIGDRAPVVTFIEREPADVPGDSIVEAVRGATIGPATRVWAAGEAAAMQRVRRHLFDDRGVPRPHTTIRGYWKHGRAGDASDE